MPISLTSTRGGNGASLLEALRLDEDWTCITARNERKKKQNRLNQRAHRQRQAYDTGPRPKYSRGRQPYCVNRWRINEFKCFGSGAPSPQQRDCLLSFRNPASDYQVKDSWECFRGSMDCERSLNLHLPSDNLLHLIHHNVFRALTFNKTILRTQMILTRSDRPFPLAQSSTNLCDGFTVIHQLPGQNVPVSLQPTALQRACPHPSWMNMLPFPEIRDNLIRATRDFDHGELCTDLFGEIFPCYNASPSISCPALSSSEAPVELLATNGDDEDGLTAARKGLIVWGEPWDVAAWEVTPGFVRKWSWILNGCEKLIASSNRWRAQRYEEPLHLVM